MNPNNNIEYTRKTRKRNIPIENRKLYPCAKELLSTPLGEGSRNNTLVMLTTSVLDAGWDEAETEDIMREWNSNNIPPLSENEFTKSFRSAVRMYYKEGMCYGCTGFLNIISSSTCNNCSVNKR